MKRKKGKENRMMKWVYNHYLRRNLNENFGDLGELKSSRIMIWL